jgi:hypothetical protein
MAHVSETLDCREATEITTSLAHDHDRGQDHPEENDHHDESVQDRIHPEETGRLDKSGPHRVTPHEMRGARVRNRSRKQQRKERRRRRKSLPQQCLKNR